MDESILVLTAAVYDEVATNIANKLNRAIEAEDRDCAPGIARSPFYVYDVGLSKPRTSSTGGIHNFYDFYFKIKLLGGGGTLDIVFTKNREDVWSSEPTRVFVSYDCDTEKAFKDVYGYISGHSFKYLSWEAFMEDLDNIAVKTNALYNEFAGMKKDVTDKIRNIRVREAMGQ
jgi:hypothetical protein